MRDFRAIDTRIRSAQKAIGRLKMHVGEAMQYLKDLEEEGTQVDVIAFRDRYPMITDEINSAKYVLPTQLQQNVAQLNDGSQLQKAQLFVDIVRSLNELLKGNYVYDESSGMVGPGEDVAPVSTPFSRGPEWSAGTFARRST